LLSEGLFSNRTLAILDVINANDLGLWEISGNMVNLDPKTSEIIGLEGENQLEFDEVLEITHQDDRHLLRSALTEIIKTPGKDRLLECRFLHKKEKKYVWLRLMGKSYLNQGQPVVLGTSQHIDGRAMDIFNTMLNNITNELNRKDELNKCLFDITEVLLNVDETDFELTFQNCLEIIAGAVGLARLYVYKNHIVDGILCSTEIHEWVEGIETTLGEEYTKDIPIYSWPGLEEVLTDGKTYNRLVKNTPKEIQEMTPKGIKALLIAPIFLKDFLWGFVGYEKTEEKVFNIDEESILCSAGLLLANSLIRNDLNRNLYLAVDKINTTTIKAEVLERYAYTDTLTGVYNRRYFMELAQKPLDKAKRFGDSCYAMIMDLDFFKKVNDTYGHLAGDEVLKNAAMVMKNALRSYDLLCRYGGEEFVIFTTATEEDMVYKFAMRLCNMIERTPINYEGITISVTASFGAVQIYPGDTFEDAMLAVDAAMYKAKHNGKNQVMIGVIPRARDIKYYSDDIRVNGGGYPEL